MTARSVFSVALVCAAVRFARADDLVPPVNAASELDAHLAKARDFHAAGDFARTREELLLALQIEPRPELLFALGQVEFNLAHYQAALDYYERFAATNPAQDQAALVQQAIGAARIELDRPKPLPPPPPPLPPHRSLDTLDRALVSGGAAAILTGCALVFYGHNLAENHRGSLHDYDLRIKHAHTAEWSGVGGLGIGAIAVAVGLIRWRVHLVETTIEVRPTAGGVAVLLERPL